MIGKLRASVSSRETAVSGSSRASSVSYVKTKCCQLFLSCFRMVGKKESLEEAVDNDANEYDYVVEKLVVKRVPFILVSMPGNSSERKINSESRSGSSKGAVQSVTKLNAVYPTVSATRSLLYYSDRFDRNTVPIDASDRCLHYSKNTAALNKRNERRGSADDYDAKIIELMNTLSSLHPDLKEHEGPPKDPLNIPESWSVSSTGMPLKGFLDGRKDDRKRRAFKSQSFVKEPFSRKKEFEIVGSPETVSKNDRKIDGLNRLARVDLDYFKDSSVSKFKEPEIIKANKINMEDYDRVNSDLRYDHRSKMLSGNIGNSDPSDAILRWKIIVKRYKSKPQSFETSQKLSNYFNIS